MIEALAIIFVLVVVACTSLFLLPVVLVLGLVVLLFSGFLAGAELIIGLLLAIAVGVTAIVFLPLLVPLLIPVLLVCGIVFIVKHLYKAVS